MTRFLVVFKSHAEGPADVHFVDVRATSTLRAITEAKRCSPPMHPWQLVHAVAWPRGARGINAAALAFTGTDAR